MRKIKITLTLIFTAYLLGGCWVDKTEEKSAPQYKRAYIVSKSDDNNWSTNSRIEVDSFTMVSANECIFYVDGHKSTLIGQIIKCNSNPYYNQK